LSGLCAFVDRPTPGVVSHSLFTGPALRGPVEEGRAEFIPVFLSDIPALLTSRCIPLDVALLQLSPPDGHGNCTLGTSVDAAKAAHALASRRRLKGTSVGRLVSSVAGTIGAPVADCFRETGTAP